MIKPDFIEQGKGSKVILLHSSVAGARQWRSLMAALAPKHHTNAINLFGYGKTAAWGADHTQTLTDQARLIEPFLPTDGGKISIVGHSFGGSVAMKAAALYEEQINRLVLIEPNPFYLLAQNDRATGYAEAVALQKCIKENGSANTWEAAAVEFVNYWTGTGGWDAMTAERQAKFTQALKPNFHEWDAVMNEQTPISDWASNLPRDTTFISAADTVHSIQEIGSLFRENVTNWHFEQIERGGHMAAMTNPDRINPIVEIALR